MEITSDLFGYMIKNSRWIKDLSGIYIIGNPIDELPDAVLELKGLLSHDISDTTYPILFRGRGIFYCSGTFRHNQISIDLMRDGKFYPTAFRESMTEQQKDICYNRLLESMRRQIRVHPFGLGLLD